MTKVINVDLQEKNDFLEKYNHEEVTNDLVEYLIKEARHTQKDDNIIINFNVLFNAEFNIKEMLIKTLKEEYLHNINDHRYTNLFQIILFLLGIIFLSLSTLFKDGVIWKEILVIGGWVPIWEMVELELFNDVRGRKRKKIINKLINSEINVNFIK